MAPVEVGNGQGCVGPGRDGGEFIRQDLQGLGGVAHGGLRVAVPPCNLPKGAQNVGQGDEGDGAARQPGFCQRLLRQRPPLIHAREETGALGQGDEGPRPILMGIFRSLDQRIGDQSLGLAIVSLRPGQLAQPHQGAGKPYSVAFGLECGPSLFVTADSLARVAQPTQYIPMVKQQLGIPGQDGFGQTGEITLQHHHPAMVDIVGRKTPQHARRIFWRLPGQIMLCGHFVLLPTLVITPRGPLRPDEVIRVIPTQRIQQEFAEKLVVAIPAMLLIQTADEEIFLFQFGQHGLGMLDTGQGRAGFRVHLAENGGSKEKSPGCGRLPLKRLTDQIIEQIPVGALDAFDDAGTALGIMPGQCGQHQL